MISSVLRRRWRLPLAAFMAALLALPLLSACDDGDHGSTAPTTAATASQAASGTPAPTEEPLRGEIVVFAAASLTDAFKAAARAFQTENPGVKVTFNFAASSALATQINEGAPADVFASADLAQMKNVSDKGNARESKVFATNVPVVIVPASGSPVAAFADLAKPAVRLVLAGPEVPIGKYSRQILEKAAADSAGPGAGFAEQVLANVKSNEANVRAVLTKVQLGEADAGIVYATDATIAGKDVKVIEIPGAWNVIAEYPAAVLDDAPNSKAAEAWLAFLLSPDGQAVLAKHGFGAPPR